MSSKTLQRLHLRDRRFYFRAVIPKRYRSYFKLSEIKLSLHTDNRQIAVIRCRSMSNSFDIFFREENLAQVPTKDIEEAARAYFQKKLNFALEVSIDVPESMPEEIDTEVAGSQSRARQISLMLRQKKFDDGIVSDAMELLRKLGVQKPQPEALRYACQLIARANLLQGTFVIQELSGGTYDAAPNDPVFRGMLPNQPIEVEQDGPTEKTLGSAIDDYLEAMRPAWVEKTRVDQRRSLAFLLEIAGTDLPLRRANTDVVKAVRDALVRLPKHAMTSKKDRNKSIAEVLQSVTGEEKTLSLKTQEKYFSMMRSFFLWAKRDELIEKIPGENITITSADTQLPIDDRDPYSDDRLLMIFTSPIYSGCKSEARRADPGELLLKDAYYWVPLIALYSGMRLGEIIQLWLDDVKFEANIPYFDLCPGGDKTFKSKAALRRIPVHPVLIKAGFLDHWEQAKKSHSVRIFEEVERAKSGYYSANFSKWWGRYGRAIGFHDEKAQFHSFRHNFTDGMRRADVSPEIAKELDGHAKGDVHSRYGSRSSVIRLYDAIEPISFPAVEELIFASR